MKVGLNPRVVHATAETTELTGILGRVLFPSMRQGPWLPLDVLADTTARSPAPVELHSHTDEEVVNYVLEGGIVEVDSSDRRQTFGEGSVVIHAASTEYRHDVVPPPDLPSRWISVVTSLGKGTAPSASASRMFHASPPVEVGSGILESVVVGSRSEGRSRAGTEISSITFRTDGVAPLVVAEGRRAVIYVTDGQGTVATRTVGAGDGVLTENVASLEVEGKAGLRVILVTVPSPIY